MTEQELRAQYEQEMALREQYEREVGGSAPVDDKDAENYLQEMHPDVTVADRALAKNFSKDEATTMQFLQTRYPNMDIEKRNGRIFMKNRGEKQFRAFDPEGWGQYLTSPLEAVRDVGDVVYDVGAGVAEGAAAAAAAVAATPATGGLGAIPAAMAAGGATGTAAEYLRQKAGMILGLPQEEVSGDDLLMAGASGAAAPLLFGTGGVVKAGAKGVGQEALQASQRGVLKRGYDTATETVFPKAAEMLSGVPASATRSLAKNLNVVDELNQSGVLSHAEGAQDMVVSALNKETQTVGKALQDSIEKAGEKVDISKVKQAFKSHMDEVRKNSPRNQETDDLLASLQAQFDNMFTFEKPKVKLNADGTTTQLGSTRVEMPNNITAMEAFNLQDQLKDSADFFRVKGGPGQSYAATASRADKKGMGVARGAYGEINAELDRVTSGVSSEMKNKYKDLLNLKTKLQPMFKDPETTFKTLSNLGAKSRKPTYEVLENMDKSYGTKVIDRAKELEAYKYFGEPAQDAISSQGVTSTSRSIGAGALGGLAGYYAGQETGLPTYVSMPLGTVLGAKMASPAVLKGLVRGGKAVDDKLQRFTPNAKRMNQGVNSAWMMMDERE
jgi:hypothetical protein